MSESTQPEGPLLEVDRLAVTFTDDGEMTSQDALLILQVQDRGPQEP